MGRRGTGEQRAGAGRQIDWAARVAQIQEQLYLSQSDIAARCGVARQTVSAWMHRRRFPGLYARRELQALAAEAGLLPEGTPVGSSPETHRDAGADWRQLKTLFDQLPPDGRVEVLQFARFRLLRERG